MLWLISMMVLEGLFWVQLFRASQSRPLGPRPAVQDASCWGYHSLPASLEKMLTFRILSHWFSAEISAPKFRKTWYRKDDACLMGKSTYFEYVRILWDVHRKFWHLRFAGWKNPLWKNGPRPHIFSWVLAAQIFGCPSEFIGLGLRHGLVMSRDTFFCSIYYFEISYLHEYHTA